MDYETDATCILDESGLICCICMEGYVNHPRKILGIYTFFKCCQIEDFENISRKTQGYTSVSGCYNTYIFAYLSCNLQLHLLSFAIALSLLLKLDYCMCVYV